jgi:hypothetical protein
LSTRDRPADRPTLCAVAAAVYATCAILHEGIGHGGACLLTGGAPVSMSSVHFECSQEGLWVSAGGTLINLAAGLLAWALLQWTAPATTARHPTARYALWLFLTVNLMQGCGYFLFSGIGNIGDWAEIVRGRDPAWIFRGGLAIGGGASYLATVVLALRSLREFLGGDPDVQRRQARRLTLIPYLAGGLLSIVAGAFNPVGMILVAISAAAASLGGTSGLAWMANLLGRPVTPFATAPAPVVIARSRAWIVTGILAAVIFVALWGPGFRFN